MELTKKLACSVCFHVFVEQGNLETKIRYCPKCFKFTNTMLIRINVEDEKPTIKISHEDEPKYVRNNQGFHKQ